MLLFYVIDIHIGTNRRKFRTLQLAKHDFTIKRILTRGKKHTRCLPLMRANRTFALFFMVLDLRLVKIGCRETINFFLYLPPSTLSASCRHAYYRGHSLFRRSSSQHKQHMSLKRLFSLSYLQKMRRRVKVFFFLFVLLHKMLTSISQYHEHHVTTIP